MSNIWNRGSEPSGGIPVAPDEKVGSVLVPADWVLVLSVCKRQRDTFLKNQLFIQCSLHNNFQPSFLFEIYMEFMCNLLILYC